MSLPFQSATAPLGEKPAEKEKVESSPDSGTVSFSSKLKQRRGPVPHQGISLPCARNLGGFHTACRIVRNLPAQKHRPGLRIDEINRWW